MSASLFDQLIEAIRSYQTGVTNVRRILAPLFDDATADEQKMAFLNQAQGDPLGLSQIQTALENTGLTLPDDLTEELTHLDFVVDPVGDGEQAPTNTDDSTLHATQEAAALAKLEAQAANTGR